MKPVSSTWTVLRSGLAAVLAGLALLASPQVISQESQPAAVRIALIEGLSGPFANAGRAVLRNLVAAVERVNARGGVVLPGGKRPLELLRLDSKNDTEEALARLRAALDGEVHFVLQGNSSGVAAAIVDALDKHNEREPARRAIFLNYSAVEPSLTNEKCSFWHFRFDAHADMRLNALTDVMRDDGAIKRVYLIGQDYSFGQHVVRRARQMIAAKRPDIEVVGQELHPMGRVKDFLPYATKIKASGSDAVLTGNWGNDLTLLVKAVKDIGLDVRFYTFYGNALGVPSALADAGVGRVLAVAEWHPNVGDAASETFLASFRQRFPEPRDDYLHARMHVMVEMLVAAMERAASIDATDVAFALENLRFDGKRLAGVHDATMRSTDHQLQQALFVSVMDRIGTEGVKHDVEGSGYGFRTVKRFSAQEAEMGTTCKMSRPGQ